MLKAEACMAQLGLERTGLREWGRETQRRKLIEGKRSVAFRRQICKIFACFPAEVRLLKGNKQKTRDKGRAENF